MIPALALCVAACSTSPTSTPTKEVNEATRRAATLAAFPTAAALESPTPIPSPTVPLPTAVPTEISPPTALPTTSYEVQKGDTLSTIAAKNSVSVAALQLANNLGEIQDVQLGAKLKIPTTKLADDESTYWFIYIVKSGDTLSTIAARFKVEVADVLRVNRIDDAARVLVDQQLIIPVKAPQAAVRAPAQVQIEAQPPSTPEPVLIALVVSSATPDAAQALVALAPPPATPMPTPTPTLIPVEPIQLAVAAPNAVSVAHSADAESLRAEILALHNAQRIAAGLPPLVPSAALQAAAQMHAEDCVARGFGSHVGSDSSSSRMRIARAGYGGTQTGENWAFARSAAVAFQMWFHQESPSGPHRRNIMSADFSEVGFGIAPMRGGFIFIANLGG